MPTRFECTIPILWVRDIQASLAFYEQTLGFTRDWGGDDASSIIASISRDDCHLMLFERGQGNPGTWAWVGVEDVQPLYELYRSRGAKIILPPSNFRWALEMRVEDPDSNVLRIGSESLPNVPFAAVPH